MKNKLFCLLFLLCINNFFLYSKKKDVISVIQIPPSETKEQYISYRRMVNTVHMSITYPKDLIKGHEYIFRYVHGRLWWYYISDLDYDTEGGGYQHRLVNKLVNKQDWEEAWVNSIEVDTPVKYFIWWMGDINQSGYVASRRGEHPECNNPFNIVYNKQTRKLQGCMRQDKYGFCMFKDEELGIRAGLQLILGYQKKEYPMMEFSENFLVTDHTLFLNTITEKLNIKKHHSLKKCEGTELASSILSFIHPTNRLIEKGEFKGIIDKYDLLGEKNKFDNIVFYGDSTRHLPLGVHRYHFNNQLDGIIPGSKELCH